MFLKNDFLQVEFSALGAELKSILTANNKELLWQGDANFWAKTSPVLFPIVGGLKNNYFEYENKKYQMNRHGFAREKIFDVEQKSSEEIVFTLKSNSETLLIYPFEFIFKITYTLKKDTLNCNYSIKNTSSTKKLLFSVGGHPAFNLSEGMPNYELIFNHDNNLIYNDLNNGLIDFNTTEISLKNNTLPLKHELFYNDALILKTLKSDEIILRNKIDQTIVKFSFKNFPYFGIWAAKNANFICLEPWCGIADNTNHNNLLSDKEGINTLMSNDIFERNWSIITEQ